MNSMYTIHCRCKEKKVFLKIALFVFADATKEMGVVSTAFVGLHRFLVHFCFATRLMIIQACPINFLIMKEFHFYRQ